MTYKPTLDRADVRDRHDDSLKSALEDFTAFRGREPSPDDLLRHSGMIAA